MQCTALKLCLNTTNVPLQCTALVTAVLSVCLSVAIMQLLLLVKEGTSGDLRAAVLDILTVRTGGSGEDVAAQLEAAITASRPATPAMDEVEGALAIGRLAGRLVNVVVGVAALQLVKGVAGTVLEQVRFTAEQRLWLFVIALVCWVSAEAHAREATTQEQ